MKNTTKNTSKYIKIHQNTSKYIKKFVCEKCHFCCCKKEIIVDILIA